MLPSESCGSLIIPAGFIPLGGDSNGIHLGPVGFEPGEVAVQARGTLRGVSIHGLVSA